MMGYLRHRAVTDALALLALGVFAGLLATWLDAFEHLVAFLAHHEEIEADELLAAVVLTGWCGFIYALRRLSDLRRESRRRRQAEGDADWMASHDPLTRLPNRHFLAKLMEQREARYRSAEPRTGVLRIDLAGFKQVNDALGHLAGDGLLAETAERLRAAFPDTTVLRVGGNEFMVIMEEALPWTLPWSAQRALKAVRGTVKEAGEEIEIGVRVGAAAVPEHGPTLREVLRGADVALQAARQGNRNEIRIFDPAMRAQMQARAWLDRALPAAVQSGAIRPYYQPVVDLAGGHVAGFEALARWRAPDGRFVPPDQFIAAAERCGLIGTLSEHLLRQVCEDAAGWPAPVWVAFNLSPLQLADSLLARRIIAAAREATLPAQRLEVEITESALIQEPEVAQRVIDELRGAGIRVALDDFGTGYSSLALLSRFSFDKIKIDRSFIRSFRGDEKQMKIVRSILGLGLGLGTAITAEGIEEAGQQRLLRELGCQYGQGYLFGAAMPCPEAASLLARNQPERKQPAA
ncbi:EAL domain-containing protein [Roseomonas sp. E05]|uniref:putative bifunctional diguanylate cyclase/phosphodiesterase n=1 Tax=Roseomonas sp. E05 TaxID=3046310 RepID=UPI0024B8EA71|nr:EAL domain-containing protein [Roseomonas sp. E05]MDJ0386525.1 EAL domain-containing protein [Roseomonas sp. E05]